MELWAARCGSAPGVLLTGQGVIDTVFSRAINVRMAGGLCLSIVEGLDCAPNRIVLTPGMLGKISARPGEAAEVWEDKFRYRDTIIHFTPSKPGITAIPHPTTAAIDILQKSLTMGRGACQAYLSLEEGDVISNKVVTLAQSLMGSPGDGYELIGLGQGFTPAGDDILTGYCAVMKRLGLLDPEWSKRLVNLAFSESTTLSATSIYFACLGQVQEFLDDVLRNLATPAALTIACRQLINKVGSTSGSDTLLGVLIACRYYCRLSKNYSHSI